MTHSFLTRVSSDLHVICGTVLECDRAILGMDAVSHGKTCDEKRERARIVMKRAGRRKRGVSGPQIGGCGSDAGRRTTTVPASLSCQPCLRRSNATQIRPRNSGMIDTKYAR